MLHIDESDLFLRHEGETIFVIGNDSSREGVPEELPGEVITIDGGWKHRPDAKYCVINDRPFYLDSKDRDTVLEEKSGAAVIPSYNRTAWQHWIETVNPARYADWLKRCLYLSTTRFFHLGRRGFPNPQLGEFISHHHSAFLAAEMACYMGARRVCVVGVDCLSPQYKGLEVRKMSAWWKRLTMRAGQPDVRCQIVNSSPISRVKGMQFRHLKEVIELGQIQRSGSSAPE